MAWITNGARLYRMRRIHRKLPEIGQIHTVRSTRHARHLLFLFPDDYGTLLPPKPSFSSFMEPVLSSLTVTIVLLFALELSSLHENIVLLYVALQLPLFQCFRFWETWRVITLHFMKNGYCCYPTGDIRPGQRMKRGTWKAEGEKWLNGRLNRMVAEREEKGDGSRASCEREVSRRKVARRLLRNRPRQRSRTKKPRVVNGRTMVHLRPFLLGCSSAPSDRVPRYRKA